MVALGMSSLGKLFGQTWANFTLSNIVINSPEIAYNYSKL